MMGTVLRLGDTMSRQEEAVEIMVKTSKCTALARPKSWKRFGRRKRLTAAEQAARGTDAMDEDEDEDRTTFAQLRMRTEFYLEQEGDEDEGIKKESRSVDGDAEPESEKKEEEDKQLIKVEKEELVRGYKYGAAFVPPPEGGYARLKTRKGIEICGFFARKNFRRELSMGEVYYVWADPSSPMQQVALSSIVQAMYEKGTMAIAKWVSKDDMDPKMGVLCPSVFHEIDCLLWVQVRSLLSLSCLRWTTDV